MRSQTREPERGRATASKSLVESSNDFALELYARLLSPERNGCFSPFSVRMALEIASAGARGQTAAEIGEVLRPDASEGRPSAAFADVAQRLRTGGSGQYTMDVANALWVQEGTKLLPEFLESIERCYQSALKNADFQSDPEAARVAINKWVEEITRQRIRELVPRGSLTTLTNLVLCNAVYFKGTWDTPFWIEMTVDSPFYKKDGNPVIVPLMHRRSEVRYLSADGWQAIEMGYRGNEVSFLVFLPDAQDGLSGLERQINSRLLADCVQSMTSRLVNIFLPRFSVHWASELSTALIASGMRLAFQRFKADFSGINGIAPDDERAFFLGYLFHQARIEVNEAGTEAAAALAGVVLGMPLQQKESPIPTFRADHPFLFALRDRQTGILLFVGRVADPTAN